MLKFTSKGSYHTPETPPWEHRYLKSHLDYITHPDHPYDVVRTPDSVEYGDGDYRNETKRCFQLESDEEEEDEPHIKRAVQHENEDRLTSADNYHRYY